MITDGQYPKTFASTIKQPKNLVTFQLIEKDTKFIKKRLMLKLTFFPVELNNHDCFFLV